MRPVAAIAVLVLATIAPARAGDGAERAADEAESPLPAAQVEPSARSAHLEAARRVIETARGSAGDARCQAALSRALVALGRFEEGEKAGARAASLAPKSGPAWRAAGEASLALGDPASAAARFLRAIDAD